MAERGTETTAQSQRKAGSGKGRRPKKSRKRNTALVEKMIEKIEAKLEADELKPSVGDFIRLLQLEKELEQEQPREIKVSWVEPGEEEHATDK